MPRSSWFFVFTALVFGLQLVPFVGAVLMILAASMWPLLTVNLGFVGIALEALSGSVSRRWLILPVAYFGGNLALAAISHYQLWQLENRVEAVNAEVALPFDSSNALIVDADNSELAPVPRSLLRDFDIPVVYQNNADGRNTIFALRMAVDPMCRQLWRGTGKQRLENMPSGYHENGKLVKGMCVWRRVEAPGTPYKITVSVSSSTSHENFLLPYDEHTISIHRDNQTVKNLMFAQARPLNWIPLPFGGCFPNTSGSNCVYGPFRIFPTLVTGGEENLTALVAKALGLHPSVASSRKQKIAAQSTGLSSKEPKEATLSLSPE
ncbi:MAG: hypothetical protein K0M60_03440 [Hydrogenophaga sp.]|nr:hypothetical protein [Hydrogenophaga sp.]